jgi:hypothetical protein
MKTEVQRLVHELLNDGYSYEYIVNDVVAEFGLSRYETKLIVSEEMRTKIRKKKDDYSNFGGVF